MIVTETKSKLEDGNKTNTSFMYGEQVFIVKSNKRKQKAYFIMVL